MMAKRHDWAWLLLLSMSLSYAIPLSKEAIDGVSIDEEAIVSKETRAISKLSPEELFGPNLGTRSGREKRKLSWVLDLILWKVNKVVELKTWILSGFSSRPKKVTASLKGGTSTTQESPIEFEGSKVSLVLPDELFGSAFTVITDVSKIIGSVIQNSARRTKTFFEALKPIFRNAFGIRTTSSTLLEDETT